MTKICEYSDNDQEPCFNRVVLRENPEYFRFRRLIEWLQSRGARFEKCEIRHIAEGCRATFARDRIQQDEEIVFIPKDFIITSEISLKSQICRAIKESGVNIRSKHTYLASYLLQERDRGNKSWWFPYIDVLPKKFTNIPLFFEDHELAELKGSIALQKIKDRHDSLRMEYENLCEHVSQMSQWTYNDFVWARLVVITRIFGLLINGVKTDGLVPMADMINHKRPRQTRWTFNQEKDGFVISALQDFESGCEIFDSYGRKCNSRFFVNYGFSLEDNLDNEAQFRIEFKNKRNSRVFIDFQIPMSIDDKKTKDMLSLLRWSVMQQGNSIHEAPTHDHAKRPISGQYITPLSPHNEHIVLNLIQEACYEALNRFDHTLKQDNKYLSNLAKYPLYSKQRNIIIMRRGEKEVLNHWITLTCVGIRALESLFAGACDFEPFIASIDNVHIQKYASEIVERFTREVSYPAQVEVSARMLSSGRM